MIFIFFHRSGSELIPLEISGHENQGEQRSANIADSILFNAIQHTQVNERHDFTNSNNGSFVIDNMPDSPRAPHEPSKLVFAAIIELFYVCFPSIFNCSAFTWSMQIFNVPEMVCFFNWFDVP
ncbi:hypothetical protein L6164_002861 [Bauhinia variegata]|uniref:Uncharacterized protein n=1 Tax=Bauhinia variegata TaxID=167791 RepID=A0ACB9PZN1_BAUVA|nr:hypothetical protein L6164_002861 [Bauhinia variegata]